MRKLIVVVLSLVFFVAAVGFFPVHFLEMTEPRTGKIVFVTQVRPGDTFSLTFIHSVEKSMVRDHFRIDDTYRIVLYETAFSSINAGLPATHSPGETLIREGDVFRLVGINRVLPGMYLWVDEEYQNRLEIGGRVIDLFRFSGRMLLRVGVRDAFAWEYLCARIR